MAIYFVTLTGHTAKVNELMYSVRSRILLKSRDRAHVRLACYNASIPRAVGKRRVSLLISLAPRRKSPDPDSWWKSLLDALVQAGALVDDSDDWCECGPVIYEHGTRSGMVITLEDI